MRKLSSRSLLDLLKDSNQTSHSNLVFNLEKDLVINFYNLSGSNAFENCEFFGGNITIEGNKHQANFKKLTFQECRFDQSLTLHECFFKEFTISASVAPINIFIQTCTIQKFQLKEINQSINQFEIKDSKFKILLLRNLSKVDKLQVTDCMVSVEADFNMSSFGQFDILNSEFKEDLCCIVTRVEEKNTISHCEINNLDFGNSEFKHLLLSDSNIRGVSKFELLTGKSTTLDVLNCTFHKHVDMETTSIRAIYVRQSKFLDTVSFQDTILDRIYFNKVLFEKLAFFDDIEINQIQDCDIRSIRTIKQQLLLADNKIDYVRFRRYELDLHRLKAKMLLTKGIYYGSNKYKWIRPIYRRNKLYETDGSLLDHLSYVVDKGDMPKINKLDLIGDYIILTFHRFMSKYGTDWKQAVFVTLILGLIFYSLLYYSINYTNALLINSDSINRFFNGLPRFFIITDFKNPLAGEGYYKNAISWVPVIIGKILIAFGIYETIQSFRKFKK